MLKTIAASMILNFAMPTVTSAFTPDAGSGAIGLTLGTTSSVSGKYLFTEKAAMDLGVAIPDRSGGLIYADFLWHFPGLFGKANRFARESWPYLGAGLGAGFWRRSERCGRWKCDWPAGESGSGNAFLIRAIGGVEWFPPRHKFGIFAEAGPSFMWYPGNGSALDLAIGGRYYY